jgi:ketosteroid isomerase-like protein
MTMTSSNAATVIQAMSDEFERHANAGNVEPLLQSHYAEDARVIPPNHGIVAGRSDIRAFFQGMVDAGAGDLAIQTLAVEASGDLAYRVGTYTLGKPTPDNGPFLEVYKRQPDGSWRCVADMFGTAQPAPAGAAQ